MANIVCPGCSRIVDDSVRVCPGCKYNIKKYVKDLKKKGGITGSISLGSAYDETKTNAPVLPELDFLKPKPAGGPAPQLDFLKSAPAPAPAAAPVPELDFLKSAPAPAPAAAPVPETQIYGTTPYQPGNSAPSYDTPVAQAAPVPETQIYGTTPYQPEASAPSYDVNEAADTLEFDTAPAETAPAETASAHPAPEYVKNTLKYKPKVMATNAPEYDPDYKNKQAQAAAAVPETQIYGTAPAPAQPAPAAAPVPAPAYQPATAPAAPVPETQIYGTAPAQPAPAASPVAPNVLADPPVGGFSPRPSQTSNLSAHTASNINMPNGGLLQAASTGEQLFDSPLLNLTAVRSGAGALSGATGPSIMDKLREEEERKKMENDFVFESPNLRREESKIKTVGTANAGGALSNIGDMTFDYDDPDKKDIFRSTEKFKIGAGGDEQRKRQEEQRLLNEALNGGQYQPVRSSAYSAAPIAHTGVSVAVHAGSSISILNSNPASQMASQGPVSTQGVIPAPGQVVPAPETQIYGTAPAAAPQMFGNVPASGQVPGTGVYAPAQAGNGIYGQAPAQAGNGIYGQAPAPKSFEQTLQQPGNISHPKSAINFAPSYQSETGGFGTAAASPLYGGGQPEPQGPVSNGLSHGSNTGLSSANPFLGGGQ